MFFTIMQMSAIYREFFQKHKKMKISLEIFDILNTFAQNIDCGYTLEPPCRGGSEYPKSIFRIKNKKKKQFSL